MVYTYTPTYYTSLHDSITSICKNIIPFSFKKRRLPAIEAAEQRLSKQQSDYLKWQQESFHQILKLIGLCKEGILAETEVSAFRTHLLDTLIVSPNDYEQPIILKDKLVFLQELLYAKCISEDEYHSSKRPLLQRLAVQGVEIEARDVIVGKKKEMSNEEWSVVDLKEDQSFSNSKFKEGSSVKKIKGTPSVFDVISPNKNGKEKAVLNTVNNVFQANEPNEGPTRIGRRNELALSVQNPFWNSHINEHEIASESILMVESSPASCTAEKKPSDSGKKKPSKKWGFDGFKKWKKSESKDEEAPLSLTEKSDSSMYKGQPVTNPIGKGQDTKQMKPILHPTSSPSDFFVDKVVEDNIKKEFTRIETELDAKTTNIQLSYNHENSRVMVKENKSNTKRWAVFDVDDEENSHPNLFAPHQDHNSYSAKQTSLSAPKNIRTSFNRSSVDNGFKYNPFFDA